MTDDKPIVEQIHEYENLVQMFYQRSENVWNTSSECTTQEIFFVMERLPKSHET